MGETDRTAERAAAVAGAMEDIAVIGVHGREHGGVDRVGLERIKERLLQLAERDDLFGDEVCPLPDAGGFGELPDRADSRSPPRPDLAVT